MSHRQRYPVDVNVVNVQDWSQWPYVQRGGYPNPAVSPPWGYPTISQTNAYYVIGHPPLRKNVHHAIHALLSILTGGFWLPVWFIITVTTHNQNSRAEADYWFRIQQYRQWELAQQRALNQGG
jgi:hypothetical protein